MVLCRMNAVDRTLDSQSHLPKSRCLKRGSDCSYMIHFLTLFIVIMITKQVIPLYATHCRWQRCVLSSLGG